MSDTTDYICPECKTTYPSTVTGPRCICGGELVKKLTPNDIEELFPFFRKDKK